MTLRTRLLIVIAVLVAVYAATAYVIVSAQRSVLVGQIDQRLRTLPPNALGNLTLPPGTGSGRPETGPVPTDDVNPFTEVQIGYVEKSGETLTLVQGPAPGGIADFRGAVERIEGGEGILTVTAVDGSSSFRALVSPEPGQAGWIVAALSLDETDAAIARLTRTLWIAGGVIVVVLGMAFIWVQRLGLRPIARVTAAAEAIAAGERKTRVAVNNPRTEAGQLGNAFNIMLDERDASEARLRQFVADASHELRTPLTSVRGYLELFRQGAFQEPAQVTDVVRRLSAESARMNELVEDLLALASLDEDRPLREETVDLGQMLRDAAQDAGAVQPERPIELSIPDIGPTLEGDPALLTQLIGILVSNALAHTPIDATVRLAAADRGDEIELVVSDDGPGLDAESAGKVFDRFWRGESSRTRARETGRMGGAGLGLAIAKSIAEAHGGRITLQTAPGQGSAFTLRLPKSRQ